MNLACAWALVCLAALEVAGPGLTSGLLSSFSRDPGWDRAASLRCSSQAVLLSVHLLLLLSFLVSLCFFPIRLL